MRRSRCALRELEEIDAPVGAGDDVFAVGVLEIPGRRFQRPRREVPRRGNRPLGADAHRRSADEQRARAGAAEPRRAVGVALHDPDFLDGHAEDVDRELRVSRGKSLPHRLRRRDDLDAAVAFDGDGHGLLEDIGAGPFEERRHTPTAQPAAAGRFGAPRFEPVPIRERARPIHHLREVAAVVGLREGIRVRHLLGTDHVAAAQLDLVDAASRAPRRPSTARSCRWPRDGLRRGTRPSGVVFESTAWMRMSTVAMS